MDAPSAAPTSPSLHTRSPFARGSLQPSSSSTSSSSHPLSSTGQTSSPGRRRPWYSLLIPRSKLRTVLFLLSFTSTVLAILFSFSVLSIDLPPLDQYDVQQTPAELIQRSFEEPDFELLNSPQPHTIGCPQKDSSSSPLLLIGIFSAPDKVERRRLLREEVIPDWPSELVEFKFIFGRPTTRAFERLLADEQEKFGDVTIVDAVEHIDHGKTHGFFEWVAERRVGVPPKFVMCVFSLPLLLLSTLLTVRGTLIASYSLTAVLFCSLALTGNTTTTCVFLFPTLALPRGLPNVRVHHPFSALVLTTLPFIPSTLR